MSSLEFKRTKTNKSRPQTWTYSDPFDHARHIPFLRSKAQAVFRNEDWQLTFEEFCSLWDTEAKWAQRGRKSDDLTLTRIDPKKPWRLDNVHIITRLEQLKISGFIRKQKGMKYKPRKKKEQPNG